MTVPEVIHSRARAGSDPRNAFIRRDKSVIKESLRRLAAPFGQGVRRDVCYSGLRVIVLEGRFLGDKAFAEEIKAKAEVPGYVRMKIKPEALLEAACAVLGRRRAEVIGAGKDRERVRAREAICYVGRNCTELSVTSLAKHLGVDATCVSRSVARMESRLGIDRELKRLVDEIVSAMEKSKYQA